MVSVSHSRVDRKKSPSCLNPNLEMWDWVQSIVWPLAPTKAKSFHRVQDNRPRPLSRFIERRKTHPLVWPHSVHLTVREILRVSSTKSKESAFDPRKRNFVSDGVHSWERLELGIGIKGEEVADSFIYCCSSFRAPTDIESRVEMKTGLMTEESMACLLSLVSSWRGDIE